MNTPTITGTTSATTGSVMDTGRATGGTGTTLVNTRKDWAVDVWKYALIEITSGTCAGDVRVVSSNTSDTITVSAAFSSTPDTTSTYKIFALSESVIQNPSEIYSPIVTAVETSGGVLDSGTATAGAASTLTDTSKNWDTDIWQYAVLSITGGTGEGQTREIASNTATVITVTNAFTTTPDSTSTYKITTNNTQLAGAVNSSDQVDINIAASDIKVPTDIQAVMKTSLGSTTSALTAASSYTGSSNDASNYRYVIGMAYADQDGTAYIEQSIDGTNWDMKESFAVTASTVKSISTTIFAKYVRMTYTNGATDQTTFRYQCFMVVL